MTKYTKYPDGIWPVMITPFTENNKIDYDAVKQIVDWYIKNGVDGIFAICLSSEMFQLSLEERVELAKFIVDYTNGRVPIIACGHVSESQEKQIEELREMANTGIDALIFNLNRFAAPDDSDEVLIENLSTVINNLDPNIPLGIYECPYPYKRLFTKKVLEWCKTSGRFYFLKDTCCDLSLLKERIEIVKGSKLKLYNANSATLYESFKMGASGYSGVMANFHPDLYSWLWKNWSKYPEKAKEISDFITIASYIETQNYPCNAKYYLKLEGLNILDYSRKVPVGKFSNTDKLGTEYLRDMSKRFSEYIK